MELLKYVKIKRVDTGDPLGNMTHKAMVRCVDGIESAITQACIACAKEEGITDLYLLDRQFVIEALREKKVRETVKEKLCTDDRLILGDELLRIREKISCPQLGDDHYGEWGTLRADQRKVIARLIHTVEYLDKLVRHYKDQGENSGL